MVNSGDDLLPVVVCSPWRTQEFSKVQGIALRGTCLLMEMGATNWQLADTAPFLHAELHSKVSGARVGRVLIYVFVKCGHASSIRRPDGLPEAKITGHALNARMQWVRHCL